MNEQTILNLLSAGKKLADNIPLKNEELQAVSELIKTAQQSSVSLPNPQEHRNYLESLEMIDRYKGAEEYKDSLPIFVKRVEKYKGKYLQKGA